MPKQYIPHPLPPFPVRFWAKVDRRPGLFACWPWTGSLNNDGYGNVARNGKHLKAHRVAWEEASGEPVPDGFQVCHNCPDGDLPACTRNDGGLQWYDVNGFVRPSYGHLWIGTQADNMADCAAKGRIASGERSGVHHRAYHFNPETVGKGDRHYKRLRPETITKGDDCSWSKVTAEQVAEIRSRYIPYKVPMQRLADEYGLTVGAIHLIIKRKNWKHVP